MSTDWILFGVDLSRLLGRVKLGISQLLFCDEGGLRGRFYPKAYLLNGSELTLDVFPLFERESKALTSPLFKALIVPEKLVLSKRVVLPKEVEADLTEAMALEVESSSPFASDDTCYGWRIVGRDAANIDLCLVIASRGSLERFISEQQGATQSALPSDLELWAQINGDSILLQGFGEQSRLKMYYKTLNGLFLKFAGISLGAMLVASMPALILSINASQLRDHLLETQKQTARATALRNELVAVEDRVLAARKAAGSRVSYDHWLNLIAARTPDTVFLTRLAMEEDRLTISGMAVNAAEYQTELANSGFFSDLTAPSAFTRDSRTGKERFTLTMRMGDAK
jgi:general secretion pathway protein L